NFLRVPFVVKFQAQGTPVTLPADVAALEGEKRGTNNPTAIFGRVDFILNQKNTLNAQYTFTRLRGENFNFDNVQQDAALTTNYTRKNSSNGIKASLVSVFNSNAINEIRGQVATDDRLEEPNTNAPLASITGFGTLGGDTARPRIFDTTRYEITDNLS